MAGFMDGNDDWLKLLKSQYPEMAGMFSSLEPSAADKKSAFNNALLTAGAAMLAGNNGRGPASAAIGQGLLGGIQGYQQNISDQRKDALGRLGGLSGLMSLGQNLQSAKRWDQLMGGGGQEGPPQTPYNIGAQSSVGGGNELGDMQPMRPQQAPNPVDDLANTLLGRGADPSAVRIARFEAMQTRSMKPLMEMYDKATTPVTLGGVAMNRYTNQPVGGVIGNSTVGPGPNGTATATPIGGLSDQQADAEALKKRRELESTNPLTMGSVNVGAVQTQMPVSDALDFGRRAADRLRGNYGSPTPPQVMQPKPQQNYSTMAGMRNAIASEPLGDAPVSEAEYRSNFGVPQGVPGIGADPAVQKAREAGLVQKATMSGDMALKTNEVATKHQLEQLDKSYEKAQSVSDSLGAAYQAKALIAAGARSGGTVPTQTEILNRVNGLIGTDFGPEWLGKTQALGSMLGKGLLDNAKALGYNPSNADATRIEKIVGTEGLSMRALQMITDFQIKHGERFLDQHNGRVKQAEESGVPFKYSYKVDRPPLPDAVEQPTASGKQVSELPVNQTALYKARQAIKAGADPDEVRRRLIDRGYNPKGL